MNSKMIFILLLGTIIFNVESLSLPAIPDEKVIGAKICPQIKCIAPCPNGFVINERGCSTCDCNPCKCGQPLHKYPCGQGQGVCSTVKGVCKVSIYDNAYCCPNESINCFVLQPAIITN
ncbi:hypothetical protein I4U23_019719 [Adineta vaga]|nr:hypothetical protein I4U23_019719 [Adineta vaga]